MTFLHIHKNAHVCHVCCAPFALCYLLLVTCYHDDLYLYNFLINDSFSEDNLNCHLFSSKVWLLSSIHNVLTYLLRWVIYWHLIPKFHSSNSVDETNWQMPPIVPVLRLFIYIFFFFNCEIWNYEIFKMKSNKKREEEEKTCRNVNFK